MKQPRLQSPGRLTAPDGVGLAGLGVLVAVVVAVVLVPLGAIIGSDPQHPESRSGGLWSAFGVTFAVSAGIALLAVGFGLPGAFWVARGGWRRAPWLVGAMLMPPTLAYAGWGLCRAPGTWLGDALERAVESGAGWLPRAVGQGLAMMTLALWAAPLAALVIGFALRRSGAEAAWLVALDACAPWARVRAWWGFVRPGVVLAGGLIAVLMLGSQIPLHLAQVPTASIVLWLRLDQSPPERWGGVLLGAWPMALVAGAVGVMATRWARRAVFTPEQATLAAWPAGGTSVGLWALLAGSVLVPVVLLVASVRRFESFGTVWRTSRDAAVDSVLTAGATGVGVGLICLATTVSAGLPGVRGRLARVCVGVLAAWAVAPGVLVGAALVRGYSGAGLGFVSEQWWFVPVGHVARFGAVGALMGCLAAAVDARAQRDLRRLDGAGGVLGYVRAGLPMHAPAALAAGLLGAALSLHEVEASVIIRPPGSDSLSRQLLQLLHFSRMEELSVLSVMMVVGGLMVIVPTGLLVGRVLRPMER